METSATVMAMGKHLLILIATASLFGCSTRPCVRQQTGMSEKTVAVYKYDGTLQCSLGQEISLEGMEKELSGIKIVSKQKRKDGLMRTQVCGAGTGQANVYEIPLTDKKRAETLGFKIWNY